MAASGSVPTFSTFRETSPTPSRIAKNSAIYNDHRNATLNQFAAILHELAHIYTPHPLPGQKEFYDLNQACYLIPDLQLNNPNSYAYYAVCTSTTLSPLPVYAIGLHSLTISYPAIYLGFKKYPYIPQGK